MVGRIELQAEVHLLHLMTREKRKGTMPLNNSVGCPCSGILMLCSFSRRQFQGGSTLSFPRAYLPREGADAFYRLQGKIDSRHWVFHWCLLFELRQHSARGTKKSRQIPDANLWFIKSSRNLSHIAINTSQKEPVIASKFKHIRVIYSSHGKPRHSTQW